MSNKWSIPEETAHFFGKYNFFGVGGGGVGLRLQMSYIPSYKPAAPQKWLARWQQPLFLAARCERREEPLPLMPPVILLSSSFSSSSFFCRRSLTASLTDSCLRTSGAFSDSPQTILQMTCVAFSIHTVIFLQTCALRASISS